MEPVPAHKTTPYFRRKVFYIPGYDPFPPRRYRELYRKEGAAQAAMQGYRLELMPSKGEGYGWGVRGQVEGRSVETDFRMLVWADLVRDSMATGIVATYAQLFRTAWAYIGSGALFRLMRLRKGPVIAALYPIALLLLQLAVALGAGAMVWTWLGLWGLLPGMALVWLILQGFRRIDRHVFAWYLMHDYAHTAQHGGAYPDDLAQRMEQFGVTIRQAMEQDWDEVLVIGHSSGAHLAVSILADCVRDSVRGKVSLLTLGHVVPMVSFLPKAKALRADLAVMAKGDIPWVDVTAPGDGCAFALCDPVGVSGVATEGQRWPLILSAAFTQTLSPPRWKQLRWRFFRLHFQYLCAFDQLAGKSDDYDYFRITAGPLTLWQRFGARPPSKSRLTQSANKDWDAR
ncbi:hypothetical protein [Neogemmobacter tilapiae]|uniref:Alpha/beta hydrolase n=1 Tax=Neogemmobacter tilapiae TaxID=875041 RepID=A0A918TVS2_9RHOB|nr:hypothetical protein [Gemmobacter tilapiae]GHC58805.1 hypothetical protein GCM10007315_23200 [Gemmobacter tilapiae]